MEAINEVIEKRFSKSLLLFLKMVDPERKFAFETNLVEAWNRLSLTEQRRMYLYLLYKKWRGEGFYGTPYEIISNCKPYPTNWNGKQMLNRLMKDGTLLVRAIHNGDRGTFTLDEARVWQMQDIKPLNF